MAFLCRFRGSCVFEPTGFFWHGTLRNTGGTMNDSIQVWRIPERWPADSSASPRPFWRVSWLMRKL